MSFFKPKVSLPAGVEVSRLFDTVFIDGQTSETDLFTSNPTLDESLRNYVSNPLQGDKNHVVLAMSIDCTLSQIETEANVDPVSVANKLKASTVKLETNGGRDEMFVHPLKDYMNFSQSRASVAAATDGGTAPALLTHTILTQQATPPRYIDNLFYLAVNERFTLRVKHSDGSFPAQADFTKGQFGLQATLYVAEMGKGQLDEYERRLRQAAS